MDTETLPAQTDNDNQVDKPSKQIDIGDVWAVLNKITSEEIADDLRAELQWRGLTTIGSIRSDPDIALSCLRGQLLYGRMAAEDVSKLLDFLVSQDQ